MYHSIHFDDDKIVRVVSDGVIIWQQMTDELNGIRSTHFTFNAYNIYVRWLGDPASNDVVGKIKAIRINDETFDISDVRQVRVTAPDGYNQLWFAKTVPLFAFLNKHGYYLNHNVEIVTTDIYLLTDVAVPEPIENVVEWRPMSRTEVIKRSSETITRGDLTAEQSYTETGQDGQAQITWEAEYLNGNPTGRVRNEQRTVLSNPVNDKIYRGTKQAESTNEKVMALSFWYFKGMPLFFEETKGIPYRIDVDSDVYELTSSDYYFKYGFLALNERLDGIFAQKYGDGDRLFKVYYT
ncbi:G5 domain-containing protein [Streptococcus moroccensis]|uniref:G5 domain-containing protein n=1 Tax=Streptococcus moroccensis TaxID=1451356 RepID=A0ABT9YPR8_9STRE|nr:G5 domain-containing protein [Streptococcus moroccensis]MDQ0221978.1 hypothetical protein [Streptococcus moroccensis]